MKRALVLLAFEAVLAVGSPASAVICDVDGCSWGTFSNPSGFWNWTYDIENGNPCSTFEWGGYTSLLRSELKFTGNDICEDLVDCEASFQVGKLTFCNELNLYDICGNCGTLDLTANLHFDNPAAPDNPYEFNFDLGVCDIVCDDDCITISLPDPSGEVEFEVGDTTYFLSLADGFVDCNGCPVSQLCVGEGLICPDCDSAWLYGTLRCEEDGGPQEVIPEPATCLLLGTSIVPLVIRRLRKNRKA